MVRLQGGAYSNEGRVEVYCNGQWGTICSTGFGTTDANTICKQLGYDNYYRYNHLSMLVFDDYLKFILNILEPVVALVSQYGVLICTVHQVIGVMVLETLVHPLQ